MSSPLAAWCMLLPVFLAAAVHIEDVQTSLNAAAGKYATYNINGDAPPRKIQEFLKKAAAQGDKAPNSMNAAGDNQFVCHVFAKGVFEFLTDKSFNFMTVMNEPKPGMGFTTLAKDFDFDSQLDGKPKVFYVKQGGHSYAIVGLPTEAEKGKFYILSSWGAFFNAEWFLGMKENEGAEIGADVDATADGTRCRGGKCMAAIPGGWDGKGKPDHQEEVLSIITWARNQVGNGKMFTAGEVGKKAQEIFRNICYAKVGFVALNPGKSTTGEEKDVDVSANIEEEQEFACSDEAFVLDGDLISFD